MLFFRLQDVLQQVAADVVVHLLAMHDGFAQVLGRLQLQVQVALQHFLGVLADQQLAEVLQVGQAFEEQDALDELVGMLHLVDRLVVLVGAEALQAPVVPHARVEEVLVDRDQLVAEDLVEVLDDFLVAFHAESCRRSGCDSPSLAATKQGVKPKLLKYKGKRI